MVIRSCRGRWQGTGNLVWECLPVSFFTNGSLDYRMKLYCPKLYGNRWDGGKGKYNAHNGPPSELSWLVTWPFSQKFFLGDNCYLFSIFHNFHLWWRYLSLVHPCLTGWNDYCPAFYIKLIRTALGIPHILSSRLFSFEANPLIVDIVHIHGDRRGFLQSWEPPSCSWDGATRCMMGSEYDAEGGGTTRLHVKLTLIVPFAGQLWFVWAL